MKNVSKAFLISFLFLISISYSFALEIPDLLNFTFTENISVNDSGAITDYSIKSNNGTLGNLNSTGELPVWTSNGWIGGAYQFFSENMTIIKTRENSGINNRTPFTISLWANITADNGNDYALVSFGFANSSQDGREASIWWSSSDKIFYFVNYHSTNNVYSDITIQEPIGTWYHVAFTFNGTHAKMFINGTDLTYEYFVGRYSDGQPINSDWDIHPGYPIVIGTRTGFGDDDNHKSFAFMNPADAIIDQVKIYNRTLSPAEVSDLYFYELNFTKQFLDSVMLIDDIKELHGKSKANFVVMLNDTDGEPLNIADCNITIINARGTVVVNDAKMSYLSDSFGLYNYSYVFENRKEAHTWQVTCLQEEVVVTESAQVNNIKKNFKPSTAVMVVIFLAILFGYIFYKGGWNEKKN